jgi:hypothetical protein
VRFLLHGPALSGSLLPRAIKGCNVPELLRRLLPMLSRFGGPRLRADVARYRDFAALWPAADFAELDRAALQLSTVP